VIPEITERTCVITNGSTDAPVALQGILPDLSTFTQAAADYHRGVLCDVYTYTFTEGGKVNTYNFYVSQATQSPVSFHFLGYDQVQRGRRRGLKLAFVLLILWGFFSPHRSMARTTMSTTSTLSRGSRTRPSTPTSSTRPRTSSAAASPVRCLFLDLQSFFHI
jgi:hypothetical protein